MCGVVCHRLPGRIQLLQSRLGHQLRVRTIYFFCLFVSDYLFCNAFSDVRHSNGYLFLFRYYLASPPLGTSSEVNVTLDVVRLFFVSRVFACVLFVDHA